MAIEAERRVDLYLQNSDKSGVSEDKVLKHFKDLPVRFWDLEHKMKIIIEKWIDVRKRDELLQTLIEDIELADTRSSLKSIFSVVNNWVNSLIEKYWLYLETSDCLWELYVKILDFQKEVEKKWTYSKEAKDLLQLYEQDFQGKMHKVIKAEMRRISKLITVWNDIEGAWNKRVGFKREIISKTWKKIKNSIADIIFRPSKI